MAKVITTELQHSGASAANITLDSSKNVTCENNLQVDGNVTVTGTIPADKLTGNLPAISGASLTGITTRTTPFKNLIINGNHQISQRHTTKSNVTGEYLTDRWAGHGDAMTFDQVAITYGSTGPWTEGHRYSLRVKNEAAGSDASATGQYILYYIESQDLATSGWDYSHTSGGNNNVALSFWVKTSVAGTYYGSLWTHDGTAKAYNFSLGALSANTWAKVTKIIPGHSQLTFNNDNGQGLRLNLYTHRGTGTTASDAVMDSWHNIDYNKTAPDITHAFNTTVNATYEFTGVQLEVGDAVTDYEHRSYGEELRRCRRYYEKADHKFIGFGNAPGNNEWIYHNFKWDEPKRATPTVSIPEGGTVSGSTNSYTIHHNSSVEGFHIQLQATGDNNDIYTSNSIFIGDCEL